MVKVGFYVPCIYSAFNAMHVFTSPTKTSIRTMSLFVELTSVLSTHFLNYMFKLSINWLVVVILRTFNWNSRKQNDFSVIISYLLYCLHVHLLFYSFNDVPAEKSCAPRINCLGTSSNVISNATCCYLKGMALQETPFKSHSIWKFNNNMNSFWMI
jgi:hypothetical protein